MATYSIQQRKKAQGIKTWYLRKCVDGRQTFESLHTTKKSEAQAILDRLKLKEAMPSMPGMNDRDIESMVKDWVSQVHIVHGRSSGTAEAYAIRIKKWKDWCARNGILKHTQFTAAEAYRFVQDLTETYASKSVREFVKVVRLCRKWNTETFDLREFDPFKAVKTPKLKKTRVEFWTSAEIERIMEKAPSDSYKAFWGLMAYAGLRFAEARNLRVENIHNGMITVINGKGGKDAELPISKKLWNLISPLLKNRKEGMLIPKKDVPTRSTLAVSRLKIAVALAGIEGGEVSHHKLRHSFASELLRQGTNPRTVQELMRHSSIDTLFDHYAHVLRSDLAEAVERI
jgi:site-specific recombinase XerD